MASKYDASTKLSTSGSSAPLCSVELATSANRDGDAPPIFVGISGGATLGTEALTRLEAATARCASRPFGHARPTIPSSDRLAGAGAYRTHRDSHRRR